VILNWANNAWKRDAIQRPTTSRITFSKAADQFDAVNADRKLPNVFVLLSHTRLRGSADLQMAIEGVPMPDGPAFLLVDDRREDPTQKWEKQENLWDAAQRLHLVFWIDAYKKTCDPIRPAGAQRSKEACDLFRVKD
jgi:hypothetical protein